jgi:proline racemase
MSCEKCKRFPAPTTAFEEVANSIERHGTLYKCRYCGIYYEIVEGNRSSTKMNKEEAEQLYELDK